MTEVELFRIIIDEDKKEQVIVLKEKKGSRFIPMVIGMSEAVAIKMQLSGFVPSRPLTHDLMCSLIEVMGVFLDKVVIDKLVDSTFHAKLYIRTKDEGVRIIDARPSDSIALAVRTKSPISVEEELFDKLARDQE